MNCSLFGAAGHGLYIFSMPGVGVERQYVRVCSMGLRARRSQNPGEPTKPAGLETV